MTTPLKESITKAFVYLRVSGLGQVQGDGFERQLLACEEYAAKHGIEVVEIFREEGISGTTEMDARPALAELFVALEENGVKTVIIEKMDRLARDLLVQENIIGDMQKRGYTVISTMEPDLCSSDPSRVLVRQIFGAIAQYDRSMIVARTRAARERIRAREGKCEGPKAFGEKPGEERVLDKMASMRAAGYTFQQIADALNTEGLATRKRGRWHVGTVGKILARA